MRVCEEIARFHLSDRPATARLKKLRHSISAEIERLGPERARLLLARDTARDVGRPFDELERDRRGYRGLFAANCERAKEALRVLEEVSKLLDGRAAAAFKRCRFELYAIEKRALQRLETVRDH